MGDRAVKAFGIALLLVMVIPFVIAAVEILFNSVVHLFGILGVPIWGVLVILILFTFVFYSIQD